jgi:hypothetical protein
MRTALVLAAVALVMLGGYTYTHTETDVLRFKIQWAKVQLCFSFARELI